MKSPVIVPLRTKLIVVNVLSLSIATGIFGGASYFGLKGLSEHLSRLNIKRSEEVKANYQEISNENIQKIRSIYEKQLQDKGNSLLAKDSTSLTPMITENEFKGVSEFLQNAFKYDHDIVEATYFTLENKEIKAWYYVSVDFDQGLNSAVKYSWKKGAWEGTTRQGGTAVIRDSEIPELVRLNQKRITYREFKGLKEQIPGFDCIIPFVNGHSGKGVISARKKGEPIGFLRYFLSSNQMRQAIDSERGVLEKRLKSLESSNRDALMAAQEMSMTAIRKVLLTLAVCALLIVFGGSLISLASSNRITTPVKLLTQFAESMSKGNYTQRISLQSNDEIGILAGSFQQMSNAIQKRDAELASINKNLEKLVEERTSTIKTILNNVKFGFLIVGPDLTIQEGFTKSCVTLFGDGVRPGMSLGDALQLKDRRKEHLQVLLSQIFEDILVEKFTLSLLPNRVKLGEKSLDLAGSVIRGSNSEVIGILFTITDSTSLERAEQKSATHATLIQILQQKEAFQEFVDDVRISIKRGCLALEHQDQMAARMILHTLKGNMGAFGLSRLSQLIHEIEDNTAIKRSHFTELETEFVGFLEEHSKIISVPYDGVKEDVYRVHKASMDKLLSEVEALHPKREVLRAIDHWVKNVQMRRFRDLLGPLPEYAVKLGDRLGKKVNLTIENGDQLVEPRMLRPLIQVLPHLIRNSLNHGIESPAARGNKGNLGKLKVYIENKPSHWEIAFLDDGQGIDTDAVVKKAVNLGLVTPLQVEKMNEDEKCRLIFMDNLSTHKGGASEISGRGIGISAVANVIKEAGWDMQIHSKRGLGLTIQIFIPKNHSERHLSIA